MLEKLIKMSNLYGSNPEYVLAGGGNTSVKDDHTLIVKASGYQLATIQEDGFVRLNRQKLALMWKKAYHTDTATREKEVLNDLMAARLPDETNRPSVETQLHDLFPHTYVLHLHPTKINALTCGKTGQSFVHRNLPKNTLWIEATKPGYILAMTCKEKMEQHQNEHGVFPQVLLLENHGVFFAANTTTDIDDLVKQLTDTINQEIKTAIDISPTTINKKMIDQGFKAIKSLDPNRHVIFEKNKAIDDIITNPLTYQSIKTAFTPDHVVYCRHEALLTSLENLEVTYQAYTEKNGFPPRIIFLKDIGMFAVGDSEKQAENAKILFLDQIKIGYYSQYFGGPKPMTEDDIAFILNWEVEHYRFKVQSQ